MTSPRRVALVVVLAGVYAVCYTAIKAGLAFAPPLRFAGLRAVIGGTVLSLMLLIIGQPLFPPRRFILGTLALAAIGTLFAYGGMFLSPGRTGAGIASVIGNTGPLIVIVLAAVFLHERVTSGKAAAMSLGFIGVGLISYPTVTDPAQSGAWAAVLPLTAAAGFAGASVLIKRLDVGGAFLRVAAWQLLVGGIALLALAAWLERDAAVVWNGRFVVLLLFLAFVGTAFATAVWYWLLQRDEVGRLSLLLFLVPVFGLGLAVTFFRESLGVLEGLGVLVTIVGLGVVAWESRTNEGRTPP
ncbi:MAG: EamA family transporter [Gemmatimonadales bacterium]|nr:EamA family transporter [Gemmatimonadales bacterium]NIN12061.1 EamA family transporter [Gemmatimonadales bacterium]NIR03296.1 EamA family transporter [Gemmatimonadales bacterium]NIS66976.1 EamA family transporter [Gemmatimonadales bacterium]